MKAGKIFGGLLVAVIAVVAVVVFLGLQNLDQIIKVAIETVGPRVTGTAVTLDAVKLDLSEGRGELHGLQIDNPKGYKSDYAFYLDEVALQVDPKTLTGEVIVIKEVLVDGASLIAEEKNLKQVNLKELLENMDQGASSAESSETEVSGDTGASVRLIIEKFSFINNDARLITSQWGDKQLKMPDIKLKDIGKKENGLTPEQLGPAIMEPVLKQAERAVKKELEKLAKAAAEKELEKRMDDQLNDKQKEQVKDLKKMFNN